MQKCQLCESINPADDIICNICGYNFEKTAIADKDRLRAHVVKLLKAKKWPEEVKLKKKVNEIQIKKYGYSSTNPNAGGWSERKTAELLGEYNSTASSDIRLAEALDEYPELSACKNKSEAKKCLNQIKYAGTYKKDRPIFESERDLQKYLYSNWERTHFYEEWELQKSDVFKEGQYNTGEIGDIDLLARHRNEHRWLVIELKRDQSSDETVGQILRYMGWVKENLAGKDGKVEGLIISETADERIRYALGCVSDISLKIYHFENGKLIFKDPGIAYFDALLKKLSPDQRDDLLKKLSNEYHNAQ